MIGRWNLNGLEMIGRLSWALDAARIIGRGLTEKPTLRVWR